MTKRQLTKFNNEPLNHSERQIVVKKANESSLVTRFAVLGILYTGLNPAELSHLHPNMIRSRENGKVLILNKSVECRAGAGRRGPGKWKPKNKVNIGESCGVCDDGIYEFNHQSVPIRHDDTISVLDDFFSLYDVTPSAATLRQRIEQFGVVCEINRLNFRVLYYTFPVILAEHGFTREEIGEIASISKNTREGINFSEQVGPYCKNENPFICSAELGYGDTCDRPTEIGEDYCARHTGSTENCGAILSNGKKCQMLVSETHERCRHHSSDEKQIIVCGAELKKGGRCQAPVSDENNRCTRHSAKGESNMCGAKLDDGSRCQRLLPKSGDEERCSAHRVNQFTCGAETSTGSECERPVDSAKKKCHFHSEGHICGAERDNGEGECKRTVSSQEDQCYIHSQN